MALSPAKDAMAVGTAGLTAMFAIQALEAHGLTPDSGPVLVTGASGGVGSVGNHARALAEVAAVTGRKEEAGAYLRSLGVSQIIERSEIAEAIASNEGCTTWAGCIDSVGGEMLARILGQIKIWGQARLQLQCRRQLCQQISFRSYCAAEFAWD